MTDLFEPAHAGALPLRNRVTMAAMTRSRAGKDGVPTDLHVDYYAQRATAGLVVTEGTRTNEVGQAFLGQPGIHTEEQVEGWRRVADAVHAAGGTIVMQLMHGGRLTLPSINNGQQAEAPSAIAPVTHDPAGREVRVSLHGADGRQDVPAPRALETDELPRVIDEFAGAARNARRAGLDGVELHGANGYLLHEFLAASGNQRTDQYGGSPENRARLTVDVVRAVAEEIGADRVGLRISPEHSIQGLVEDDHPDVLATYEALLDGIADQGIAYLSILHADIDGDLVASLRQRFGGFTLLNSGFGAVTTREEATHVVQDGLADAAVVGRQLIANPDLVRRWQEGLDLNALDPSSVYTPGAHGYTDYPFAGPAA